MKCRKAKRAINRYIDNEAKGGDSLIITQHTAECGKCADMLRGFLKIKKLAGIQPLYSPPQSLWSRIAGRINSEGYSPADIAVPLILRIWVPAACILTLIAGVMLFSMPAGHKPSIQETIIRAPLTMENMENTVLKILIYTDYNREAPYVNF